ncbi:Glycosyl transferase family 2 [Bradyrhizobium brasilense]|uniref:Glycosyl transferase family 2 n=1 Tax=Bradyrhizobium brasilense TaxID=1419277 RepID=A0A1G7H5B3_9BRAD|nr:glycosyltransferase [Bradyrhizobium brasilense]SDE95319.1 Glycosyl transferase family 2 [Bradyrhizobium brasilense]
MANQTICLSMIVKNEAPVIERCLRSVLPLIDYWVICDTGSTDGTQDVIRSFFATHGKPGELHQRPWKDFAHNRSEALTLARNKADYSLIIDADDAFEVPADNAFPNLTADSYSVDIKDSSIQYQRTQLVRNALPWCYRGVLHEFLACNTATSSGHLPIIMRRNHDGARRRDPNTYRSDAAILEAALQTETDPFMRSRYIFYLAQSLRDCGERQKALTRYMERAELGFWQQEVYVSLCTAAGLKAQLDYPVGEVIEAFDSAAAVDPTRAEALHHAARYCRDRQLFQQGYEFAGRAINLRLPQNALFAEPWIYDYGSLDEYAVNAYWAGDYLGSLEACQRVLSCETISEEMRMRVQGNARFARDRIQELQDEARLRRQPPPQTTFLPKVLIAILAKSKAGHLPLFLDCIESLDYPQDRICLHIRTNNNTDNTAEILRSWTERVGARYAHVELDDSDTPEKIQEFADHEWNPARFSVLGRIRQHSMNQTLALGCDFYFVVDVDNFLRPSTLRKLVELNQPIVAPLLKCVDADRPLYSNFHHGVDQNGYFLQTATYGEILAQTSPGLHEVAVVHCTYLVRADAIPKLTYDDGSARYEYVVFSHSARRAGIPQMLDNREVYGWLTFASNGERIRPLLELPGDSVLVANAHGK